MWTTRHPYRRFECPRQQHRLDLVDRPGVRKVQRQGGGRRQGIEHGEADNPVVPMVEVVLTEKYRRRIGAQDGGGAETPDPPDQLGPNPSSSVNSPSRYPRMCSSVSPSTLAASSHSALFGSPVGRGRRRGPWSPCPHSCRARRALLNPAGPSAPRFLRTTRRVVRMGVNGQDLLGTASSSCATDRQPFRSALWSW